MIEIESSVQHCLGQQIAIERVQALVSDLAHRFPQQVHRVELRLNAHVVDVNFAAYGYVVQWTAEVFDDQVTLHGRIPASASSYESKMEQAIVARIEECLAPQPLAKAA